MTEDPSAALDSAISSMLMGLRVGGEELSRDGAALFAEVAAQIGHEAARDMAMQKLRAKIETPVAKAYLRNITNEQFGAAVERFLKGAGVQ